MAKDIPEKDYIDAVAFPESVPVQPIGIVRSPYRERHGTPRQAVVTEGTRGNAAQRGTLELFEHVVPARALGGLEGFDYVWVICWLHLNKHWNPTVVPPRGPRVRRGVLSTRAPHRPNHLGLSALRIVGVEGHRVHVEGLDLLDGTPIIDIKPYVPYCDAFPDAASGWLDTLQQPMTAPDRPS